MPNVFCFAGCAVLLIKWGTAAVSSQVPEGQQSNVPTTVTNGQPVSSTGGPAPQVDKQVNGSRFNPEKNRELQKLPLLKGDVCVIVNLSVFKCSFLK